MKIVSYNVNGIRAALRKGMAAWLRQVNPDIVLFQEIKATEDQIDTGLFRDLGYAYQSWNPAVRKGYSGTGIISKIPPQAVEKKTGMAIADGEGRILLWHFNDFSLMSLYLPSGTNDERLRIKFRFMDDFYLYTQDLLKQYPRLLIGGDFNICHKPEDIHDPVRLQHVSGFLPEERAWLSAYMDLGLTDTFRLFDRRPGQYTWWSYRTAARQRNKGWRIDYHLASESLKNNIKGHIIDKQVLFSDHAPVILDLDLKN